MMFDKDFLDLVQEALSIQPEEVASFKDKGSQPSLQDVTSFSNEKLCSIVAANRYLRINPEMEKKCMEELAARRVQGDAFLFEKQINEYSTKFTPLDAKIPDILGMFSEMSGHFRNKK